MAYQNDGSYFARRVDEELQRGDQAATSSIAAIHYELAYRYALQVSMRPWAPPVLRLVIGGRTSAPDAQVDPSEEAASSRERGLLEAQGQS